MSETELSPLILSAIRGEIDVIPGRRCGCRVNGSGFVVPRVPTMEPWSETPARIVYCPTHAAAFRLAEALARFADSAEAYMAYHREKLYADATVAPTGISPHVDEARALLREIGR